MASLDSLPADQRAVLQLVLQRGRTYDEIAKLLSIDRAAVRQRALAALDALGPQTSVPAARRAVIADYLLGQLPAGAGDSAREGMADSPSERAWARIVASELSDLAPEPLPAIPAAEGRSERRDEPEPAVGFVPAASAGPDPQASEAAPPPPSEPSQSAASRVTRGLGGDKSEDAPAAGAAASEPGRKRATSRRGGALLLGLAAAAIIAVVVILLVNSGGSSKHNGTTAASTTPTTSGTGTTTGKGTTSRTATQVLGQINLTPPTKGSKTAGIAEILRQGATKGIAIVAQKVPQNSKRDAYAVWLYNSPSDAHLLGFVNPGVTSNGRLSTAGALPTNASRFKQLIVTRETQATPKQPGTIILQGQLAGLS